MRISVRGSLIVPCSGCAQPDSSSEHENWLLEDSMNNRMAGKEGNPSADPSLLERLQEYCGSEIYPFHMPGHKRRMGKMPDPFSIDITEIEGFDNLHHAEGILKKAQEKAASVYGAEETWFLVNGSTAGILSAVGACAHSAHSACPADPAKLDGRPKSVHPGNAVHAPRPALFGEDFCRGEFLIARNCHKSVFHALYLNELTPVFVYPQPPDFPEAAGSSWICGRVLPGDVEQALEEHPKIRGVLITSPTYEGVTSDIRAIARIAHRHGVPLIVDQAHGAHFGFHPAFPKSALEEGADLVIHSLHKTMPSLTQTALLHVQGGLADREMLKRMLSVYQTSSPSYVLMASIDQCIRSVEKDGYYYMENLLRELDRFYSLTGRLRVLRILRTDDISRIVIGTGNSGLSGKRICDILREIYYLEMEMAGPDYAVGIASAGDDGTGPARLAGALTELDMELDMLSRFPGHPLPEKYERCFSPEEWKDIMRREKTPDADIRMQPAARIPLHIAWDARKMIYPLTGSAGMISAEFVYLYPPGIPLVVPGEEITKRLQNTLRLLKQKGFFFMGCRDETLETVTVIDPSGEMPCRCNRMKGAENA